VYVQLFSPSLGVCININNIPAAFAGDTVSGSPAATTGAALGNSGDGVSSLVGGVGPIKAEGVPSIEQLAKPTAGSEVLGSVSGFSPFAGSHSKFTGIDKR
jgi:hypothetical protein